MPAKQLSDAVKLRRWSATQRTRWLNRTRGLLKRARVDEVITALRELCRGRTAGKIRTHLNYFLKNRHRFAHTTMVGLGLPRGSGAVESAIRRVINLRIKGASIYWLPESVDAILLLRSFYKSGEQTRVRPTHELDLDLGTVITSPRQTTVSRSRTPCVHCSSR